MALTTRQRWMLYGLAGLLTGAALLAGDPQDTAETVAPVVRPARALARPDAPAVASQALVALAERPFSGAGRSPFGEPPAQAPTAAMAAAAAAAAQAAAQRTPSPTPAVAARAPPPPFGFLGRWTEGGVATVFLSFSGRSVAAVAGKPLTPDYLVEHIGERELQLRHVPTGTRQTLALVAGGPAAAGAATAPAPDADTEEQN
jgi:hypothetical protein